MDEVDEGQHLTKRYRRELAREQKREEREKEEFKSKFKKFVIWSLVLGIAVGGGWWLWRGLARPLPGQAIADLGREHVPDGTKVEYNSNPPTSGPHYPEWTRAGAYDKPVSDGHLLHSLEHGYVVISYNCLKLNSKLQTQNAELLSSAQSLVPIAFAHEEEIISSSAEVFDPEASDRRATEDKEGTVSGKIEESQWESQECKDLVAKLTAVFEKKGKRKLIVIPRPALEARIALTAWGRIDKFDQFDEQRIIRFIDSFRNKGPEQTME